MDLFLLVFKNCLSNIVVIVDKGKRSMWVYWNELIEIYYYR